MEPEWYVVLSSLYTYFLLNYLGIKVPELFVSLLALTGERIDRDLLIHPLMNGRMDNPTTSKLHSVFHLCFWNSLSEDLLTTLFVVLLVARL